MTFDFGKLPDRVYWCYEAHQGAVCELDDHQFRIKGSPFWVLRRSGITSVSNLCVHHGHEQGNRMVEERLRTFLMSPTLLYGCIYILMSHHPSIHPFSMITHRAPRVAGVLEPILAILVRRHGDAQVAGTLQGQHRATSNHPQSHSYTHSPRDNLELPVA